MPESRRSKAVAERRSQTVARHLLEAPPVAITIAAVFAVILVVWTTSQTTGVFRDYQAALMVNEGRSVAIQIGRFVSERLRMIGVFADQNRDLLTEYMESDDDPELYEVLNKRIESYFPTYFAFTLQNARGALIPDDLEEFVGAVCRADIAGFRAMQERHDFGAGGDYRPFIHPQPGNYHFDTMAAWKTSTGEDAVLFVSFHPVELTQIVAGFELPGHDIYLVRDDARDLIEASAQGTRDEIDRDIRLSPEELARVSFSMPIENSRWVVQVLPEAGFLEAQEAGTYRRAAIIICGIGLFWAGALWLIVRARVQRERAYLKVEELNEGLAEAQRLAHVGSWNLDLATNRLYWSDEIFRIFGIDREKFGADFESFLECIHPDERHYVETEYANSVSGKSDYDIEHRIVRQSDGEVRWVHERCKHERDRNGTVIRSEGTVQDITERKEAEHALQQSKDELEAMVTELNVSKNYLEEQAGQLAELAERESMLNKELKYESDVKDRFFSIIAHDLKSPFTSLLGMTQMMSQMGDRFEKDKLVDYSGSVNAAAERVFELLQNLLEWARLQMQGEDIEPELLELQALTEDSIGILRPVAADKDITLTNEVADETAWADGDMVRTVVRNLVANALKFSEPGGTVVISSRNSETAVEVTVSDDGVGMSEDQVAAIFALDQKTTTIGTAGEIGTGLGLPLCREMVERNGGRIWVDSAPDEGARFHFTLPAAEEASLEEQDDSAA